jgi:hypothetical protein
LGIPVVDVDVDGEDADDIHTPMQSGKKSDVWSYFDEVKDGEGPTVVRIEAICKHCSAKYSAIPANGTTHLRHHMKKCMKLKNHSDMVQAKLALNANGLANWKSDPMVARIELCRLIARLDLPLGIGETQAWSDYIKNSHNPLFKGVSRQTTTRDMAKLYEEQRAMLLTNDFPVASSISLTSDI